MTDRMTSFPGILVTYLVCVIVGIVIGVSTSFTLPDSSTFQQQNLTVTSTSVMMDGGATAVAELEDGTDVLLRGDWVAGQSVPAYAYDPDSDNAETARLYTLSNPAERLWWAHMRSWFFNGLSGAGFVIVIAFFINTVSYMRRRKTEEIIAAATS